MSNANTCVKQLIQGMVGDRQYYIELNQLLDQQRLFIIARHTAELNAVNTRIVEIYQHLSQSDKQRHSLLQQLGLSANSQSIKTLLAKLPVTHQSKVNALWEDLGQQATRCKSINEGNGMLLSMQQDILENLLNTSEPGNWLYQQV